jgi:hypothetical protein
MREHLQSTGYLQANSPTHASGSRASFSSESDDGSNYSATFRELFCITAYEIAKTLDTNLQNLGHLYEDVLTTGTLMTRTLFQSSNTNKTIMAADIATSSKDIEAGIISPILFGKGQMLVLTKKVDATEANRLQNLGYGFASIDQVGDHLARSLQIPRDDLENLVSRLHSFTERESFVPAKGTYIASFLIQPSPAMRGLEVIVPRATPDRLPMVQLSEGELDPREIGTLSTFNGLSLNDCLARITQRKGSGNDVFLEKFRNKILDLQHACPEQTLTRAIFSAKQIDIAHGMVGQNEVSHATAFAFCGIREIYIQSLNSLTLKTIPLSFYQTYLRSYTGSPDHAILAQRNHKEFSSLQRVPTLSKPQPVMQKSIWPSILRRNKTAQPFDMSWRADSCSEKGLVNLSSPADTATHPWGGIMVTSTRDIIVDETKDGGDLEMRDLGVRAEVGIAETEQQTLADKLMSITTAFRDPHTTRALPKDLYYGNTRRLN